MGKHINRRVDLSAVTYETGYGKPPEKGKFKNGHTRNSGQKMKAKKKPTAGEILDKILDEVVAVPQRNGSTKRMSNLGYILRKTVGLARDASPRHVKVVLEHVRHKAADDAELESADHNAELRKAALEDYAAEIEANIGLRKKKNKKA